jgi:hypothetical protein
MASPPLIHMGRAGGKRTGVCDSSMLVIRTSTPLMYTTAPSSARNLHGDTRERTGFMLVGKPRGAGRGDLLCKAYVRYVGGQARPCGHSGQVHSSTKVVGRRQARPPCTHRQYRHSPKR